MLDLARHLSSSIRLALLLAALPGAAALAAGPGDEYTVNQEPIGNDTSAAVASANGRTVHAWSHSDLGTSEIRARFFARNGTPSTQDIVVSDPANLARANPAIAGANRVYVAWEQDDADGSGRNIVARQVEAFGSYAVLPVNSTRAGEQTNPAIAIDPNSNYLALAWNSGSGAATELHARCYAFSFASPEITVSAGATALSGAAIASFADGAYVVAWRDAAAQAVLARRYRCDSGAPISAESAVNSSAAAAIGGVAIAADASGGYVVAWEQDGRIRARRFDAYDNALGAEIAVSANDGVARRNPRVAVAADGNFVVAWEDPQHDGSDYGVFARRFVPNGAAVGAEFQVDQHAAGAQLLGGVAMDSRDHFIAAWSTPANTSFPNEIAAREYPAPEVADLTIAIDDSVDPVEPGADYVYTVTVTNREAATDVFSDRQASNVTMQLQLPANVTLRYAYNPDWNCTLSGAIVCARIAPLYAAHTAQLSFTVTAPVAQGPLLATATVAASELDLDPANNSDSETTRINADATPNAFTLNDVTGVALGAQQTSNAIQVAGVNVPVAVTIANGLYSINGGAFQAQAGTARAGDSITVRHTSAATFDTSVTTTLQVGTYSETFVSTTAGPDTTPDAFNFTDRSPVGTGRLNFSAPVTITGINAPTTISVAGGFYNVNNSGTRSEPSTINNGDRVTLLLMSAPTPNTATTMTVTIGGVSDTFSVTTGAIDDTPDPFAFADQTGVKRNTKVTSNVVTITGITTAPMLFSQNDAEYSINGGAFVRFAGATTYVNNGDRVQLRIAAPATINTPLDTIVQIGSATDTWTITTGN
jgi:hypothetical protein